MSIPSQWCHGTAGSVFARLSSGLTPVLEESLSGLICQRLRSLGLGNALLSSASSAGQLCQTHTNSQSALLHFNFNS